MTPLGASSNRLAGLAAASGPLSHLERSFVVAASSLALPDPTGIERNGWGTLIFRWTAPAPEIGSLWVNIVPKEIVLSTLVSHRHFNGSNYLPEKPTGRKLALAIARDSASEAARVLSGEVCVTIDYDADGLPHGYGWTSKDRLNESLAYSRQVFGEGMSMRAWNWSGEVII